MRLLNFFNKALTGYKSKSHILNGLRVDYQYAGKPVLFDPFVMLNNLGFQYPQSRVLNSSPGLKRELSAMECLNIEGLIPSVICSMEIPMGKLEVKRYVKKLGDKPCSNYVFFLEGEKFAHFSRIYDYGETIGSVLGTQEISDQLKGKENPKILCFHMAQNEKFLIENFGHSHFWHVLDWQLFDALHSTNNINL